TPLQIIFFLFVILLGISPSSTDTPVCVLLNFAFAHTCRPVPIQEPSQEPNPPPGNFVFRISRFVSPYFLFPPREARKPNFKRKINPALIRKINASPTPQLLPIKRLSAIPATACDFLWK